MNFLTQFKQKLKKDIVESNGHTVELNIPIGHEQCPTCGMVYKFSKPSGQGEKWEREQHLGGYCSDVCWPLGLKK